MKTLDKFYTEEQVTNLAKSVLEKSYEKLVDKLNIDFYNGLQEYLHEHYNNFRDKVEKDLIREITENFRQKPSSYKYTELRQKLFEENKEKLIPIFKEECITTNVADVIKIHTMDSYLFPWRWKDHLVKFLLENWGEFENDERINHNLLREISSLRGQLSTLKKTVALLEEEEC